MCKCWDNKPNDGHEVKQMTVNGEIMCVECGYYYEDG
jgi:hypothetical protein